MESQVGSVLRKARNRRQIELSEVEAATRIRVRFLRAIETEEWEVLPGGVYTRGFIRTYAAFLGLDGDRLVGDYRRQVEGQGEGRGSAAELAPIAASTATRSPGERRLWRSWLVVPMVLLIGAIVIIAPWGRDGEQNAKPRSAHPTVTAGGNDASPIQPTEATAEAAGVSVRLTALAEVWVCLLNAGGEPLVEGQILEAGAKEGPFRSGSFTVSFGNGEVSMLIDDKQAEIPPTASPIGYSIDAAGDLTELDDGERPTCT